MAIKSTTGGTTATSADLGINTTAKTTATQTTSILLDTPIYIAEGSKLSNIEIEASLIEKNLAALDLYATAKEAVTEPLFDQTVEQFTTIGHVEPELQEFSKAHGAVINVLPDVLDDIFDESESPTLKTELNKYLKDKTGAVIPINPVEEDETSVRYEKLFNLGQILVKQISFFEKRRYSLEQQLRNKTNELARKRQELTSLRQQIIIERNHMESLNNIRIERLGDYVVAQKLAEEEWQRVEDEFIARENVLKQLQGLYFVKPRSVSISSPLPDPLELRYGSKDDIVPGCSTIENPSLPDELSVFIDAVLEIPVIHWKSLKPLSHLLPNRYHLEQIYTQRVQRLNTKRKSPAPTMQAPILTHLTTMMSQIQTVLHEMSQRQLVFQQSYRKYQEQGAEVLSLEDVLSSPSGTLRKRAELQRERLEQCVACLLDSLDSVPPSIRLQWAQLAEDNRIKIDDASLWPGLERAEKEDFNAIRTIVELVNWWFAQITDQADGNTRTAMNNLMRATLIVAALGDPNEILKGNVAIPPKRFQIGEYMRITLNRAAQPGTTLQLLDKQQRYVGLLRVTDHDAQGTVANIININNKDVTIDDGFTVVANKRSKQLFK